MLRCCKTYFSIPRPEILCASKHFVVRNLSTKSYYELLGVRKNATDKEIKNAYFLLSKKYHPDVSTGNHKKFIEINDAYTTLSNKSSKASYDSQLNDSFSNPGSFDFRQNQHKPNSSPFSSFNQNATYETQSEEEAFISILLSIYYYLQILEIGTCIFYTYTLSRAQREYWRRMSEQLKKENVYSEESHKENQARVKKSLNSLGVSILLLYIIGFTSYYNLVYSHSPKEQIKDIYMKTKSREKKVKPQEKS